MIGIKQQKILFVTPTSDLYFERGSKAFDQKNLEKAIHYFEIGVSLTETESNWAFGICQLALLKQYTGKIEESVALFNEALESQSTVYPEMFYFQANNYAYMENFEKAVSLASYYLAIEPNGEYTEEAEEFIEVIKFECLDTPR